MRFGREVHDGIRLAHQIVNQLGIADIALDQAHALRIGSLQGGRVAGVGELVQHHDVVGGGLQDVVDEVGADEAGSAGDEQFHDEQGLPWSVGTRG